MFVFNWKRVLDVYYLTRTILRNDWKMPLKYTVGFWIKITKPITLFDKSLNHIDGLYVEVAYSLYYRQGSAKYYIKLVFLVNS